jgi:hypothetical protein
LRSIAGEAIGGAGLGARAEVAVDDGDLMAGLGEPPGGGQANDACAKNANFHRHISLYPAATLGSAAG